MSSSWKIDPVKKDYVLQNGVPVQDDTLLTPAYIRLSVQRTKWLYSPNSQYGSDFYSSHKRITDVVEIEDLANKALKPLLDDGRAQDISVISTDVKRGAVEMQTKITDSRGKSEVLVFTPIGRI